MQIKNAFRLLMLLPVLTVSTVWQVSRHDSTLDPATERYIAEQMAK